jgi:DNA polymerase I-like protein with 3'-5' exonuclease and polymerase domains
MKRRGPAPLSEEEKEEETAKEAAANSKRFELIVLSAVTLKKLLPKNVYGMDITDDQAVQFRNAFFNEYQGLATWHETARAAANDPEVTEVRTHRIGRRQHLADVEHWWQRFTALVNTPVQGSCAEAVKLSLIDIGTKLKSRAQLVSCIHDEIVAERAEDDAEAVLAEVQAIMTARSAQVFNGQKIGVEAHVEDNWAGVKWPIQ